MLLKRIFLVGALIAGLVVLLGFGDWFVRQSVFLVQGQTRTWPVLLAGQLLFMSGLALGLGIGVWLTRRSIWHAMKCTTIVVWTSNIVNLLIVVTLAVLAGGT